MAKSGGGKSGAQSGAAKTPPVSDQPEDGGNWPTKKPGGGKSGGHRGNAVKRK